MIPLGGLSKFITGSDVWKPYQEEQLEIDRAKLTVFKTRKSYIYSECETDRPFWLYINKEEKKALIKKLIFEYDHLKSFNCFRSIEDYDRTIEAAYKFGYYEIAHLSIEEYLHFTKTLIRYLKKFAEIGMTD